MVLLANVSFVENDDKTLLTADFAAIWKYFWE